MIFAPTHPCDYLRLSPCPTNTGHWCGYKSCSCANDAAGCPSCRNHGHARNYYARGSIGFVAGHMSHPAGAL